MALTIGDKIPEILGVNQDGETVKSSDFSGKKLVLYFYPKDNTPGCTAEACSLRDGFSDLRKAGYEIVGVSADSEASHKKFIEKQQLPFMLIADADKKLSGQFGTWAEKTFMGKKYMGMLRTTFLIDETGTITKIISPKEVDTKDHSNQILSFDLAQ